MFYSLECLRDSFIDSNRPAEEHGASLREPSLTEASQWLTRELTAHVIRIKYSKETKLRKVQIKSKKFLLFSFENSAHKSQFMGEQPCDRNAK